MNGLDDDDRIRGAQHKLNTGTPMTPEQREELRAESDKLNEFHELASSIQRTPKANALKLSQRIRSSARLRRTIKAHCNRRLSSLLNHVAPRSICYRLLEQTEFAGKVVFSTERMPIQEPEIYDAG